MFEDAKYRLSFRKMVHILKVVYYYQALLVSPFNCSIVQATEFFLYFEYSVVDSISVAMANEESIPII